MSKNKIQLWSEFRIQAVNATFAIGLFIVSYLIILILALVLTVLCIAGGIALIVMKPMFVTIALGAGLASLGVVIVIFLLKFMFKSHKTDRSHLIQIDKFQEPELFQMIDEIVREVGTNFPKKVYLSADVNASVFYDSSFWSMFLPVQKNLSIGLGLVNTITKDEIKAILSHEFGHFSQRTMKVGSYVYNVNQVIFNMLYDNESYDNLIQKWANAGGTFSFFISIGVKIIQGIQWFLRKLYEVVNKSYMALSREMEFHADEIAASINGFEPLKNSLLRMALADASYNNVINFYNGRISENIKSENIYNDQSSVMSYVSKVNNLPLVNNLPEITLEEQSKYDKSKLVIKDQWASHPSINDRIARLEKTGFNSNNSQDKLANEIFKDINSLQKKLTQKIFEEVQYEGEVKPLTSADFIEEYKKNVLLNSFPEMYNGYYDNKNPIGFDMDSGNPSEQTSDFKDLFSDEKVDWVYTSIALQNDIQILNNISGKIISVKTFDYDGIRYNRKEAASLTEKLKSELEEINEKISRNDLSIYNYFLETEAKQGKTPQLRNMYNEFISFDKAFDLKNDHFIRLSNDLQFVSVTTPFEQIRSNFKNLKPLEENLKQEILYLLSDEILQTDISNEIRNNLEMYTSKTLEYFGETSYSDENLGILYNAMHNYTFLLSRKYFLMKRALLTYQEELQKNSQQR